MTSENSIQRRIWIAVSRTTTLFRLNTGRAWMSGLGPKGCQRMTDGSVLVKVARSIAVGLGMTNGDPVKGASDLLGWTAVTITPEMVGRKIAVFTSLEIKAEKGRVSDDQKNWMINVTRAGGIAGVARSPEEAQRIISDYLSQ